MQKLCYSEAMEWEIGARDNLRDHCVQPILDLKTPLKYSWKKYK